MEETLDHLDANHGGPERFARDKANLTDREINSLRDWLIE
jgi:hypothetical protein